MEKKIEIVKASTLEIKEKGKYLIILPNDANIDKIAPAIAEFFKPTPVFVLAMNDVSKIKISELIAEDEKISR